MRFLLLAATAAAIAITGCKSSVRPEPASINHQATLAGNLPYNPLAWRVVTSWTNQRNATMSTLYGNDIAVDHARSSPDHAYPVGAVLALVTWAERDDPHWFGGKIPSAPQSVEFVTMPSGSGSSPEYQRFQGSPLARVNAEDANAAARRGDYVLSQRAAVMP